jgi:hypothetical protein
VGTTETIVVDVSRLQSGIRTGLDKGIQDKSGGCPCIGQAVSGIKAA